MAGDGEGPSSSSSQPAAQQLPPDFSWKRLLADRLQDQQGSNKQGAEVFVDTDEALKGKHVALYFSAHW